MTIHQLMNYLSTCDPRSVVVVRVGKQETDDVGVLLDDGKVIIKAK